MKKGDEADGKERWWEKRELEVRLGKQTEESRFRPRPIHLSGLNNNAFVGLPPLFIDSSSGLNNFSFVL